MPDTIENSKISVKTAAILLFIAAGAISSGTVAWMTVIHANARVEYINDRLDKITKRNADDIKENTRRINTLELPNSDK